ncbi:MAG: TonB-dependent receptor [Bacteroidota bacterium]
MKRNYIYLTFIIQILIVSNIQGQQLYQTIRGKITDSQSESPLIGATVIVTGLTPLKGAVTDINGEFTIEEVPLGRHNIKATFIGYEDVILSGILVGSGKQPYLNVKMKESFTRMQEVVVVAAEKSAGKPINEMAAISAQSFSVEQTSRYAATFNDPARAALSFAGVSTGGDDILNEIVIRGNSPKGLLWRIEGIEIPNPNHFADVGSSAGGISMLSNNMMSNSDFFTGAFPAEYGNAFSGVFDIQLRNGNNQENEYAFQAGFLGLAAAAEGPFSRNSNASYLINYRYSTLALFDDLGLNITGENEDITFSDLSFKLNFPTLKSGTFSFWGLGGISLDDTRADIENGETYNEKSRNELGIVGLNHVVYLNKDTYVESGFTASSRGTEYHADSLRVKDEWEEDFTENAYRVSALYNQKLNSRNTLRTGLIFSHLSFDLFSKSHDETLDRLATNVNESGNTQLLQTYAQWQHRLTEKLTVNSGVHYSILLLNNNASLEPRMGIKYQYRTNQAFSFGAGVHSRMETPGIYLGTIENPDGSLTQANKNLDLMKAVHLVAGYQRQIADHWQIKTEAYYQYLYDVPVAKNVDTEDGFVGAFSLLNVSQGIVTGELSNEGVGRNYGLEITAERSLENGFYTIVTSSLFDSKYKGVDGVERNTRFNANYLFNVIAGKEWKVGRKKQNLISINSKFILSGNNRFTPLDLVRSQMEGEGVRDQNSILAESLNDYWRVDFGIRYIKNRPKTTSVIALNVQNVTSRENEAGRFYSTSLNQIVSSTQLALFPNLSYRLEF